MLLVQQVSMLMHDHEGIEGVRRATSGATEGTCAGGARRSSRVVSVLLGVAMAVAVVGVAPGRAAATTPTPTATWTQQHPATSPSARKSASMAYDPGTGDIVLFGGTNYNVSTGSGSTFADTWAYNGTTWAKQSPSASPFALFDASMAYDPATGQLVLFGGITTGAGISNATWTYNGTTWAEQSPATSPSPRWRASMAYDPATGQLVLFGGASSSGQVLNDTWTYNGTTWAEQSPATSPPARYGASMAYDPATGQLVLFGGNSAFGSLGGTWTYNGITWAKQSPATSPTARENASMAYDQVTGQLVLFGGIGSSGGLLNDTWTYNGTTWAKQSPVTSPPGRNGASIAYDPATGQLVLFGGYDAGGFLNDTWTYVTAPSAPTKLTAAGGNAQVALTWSAPTSDGGSPITGYDVYEGTTSGGESTTPVNSAPLSASATSYTVRGLSDGTTYYFTVKAINAAGPSSASNEVSATPATTPGAPGELSVTPGNGQVRLTWAAPSSDGGSTITGYDVYEGATPGGESLTPINATPLAATATSYTVSGLHDGTPYFFTVKAINAVGASAASNEVSATPATTPGAPGDLRVTPGNGQVRLTWAAPSSDGGSAITGYDVYEGTSSGGESLTPINATPLAATATSYTVSGLHDGTPYFFTVKAINTVGASAASNEVSATPPPHNQIVTGSGHPTRRPWLLFGGIGLVTLAGLALKAARRRRLETR